jgi:hypothetical protein
VSEVAVVTMTLWEGTSIRECWELISAAGGEAVPEFVEANAEGKAHVWVNVAIGLDGTLLCSYDADGEPTIDDLDEEWNPPDE